MKKRLRELTYIIVGILLLSPQAYMIIMSRTGNTVVFQSEALYNFYNKYGFGFLIAFFFIGAGLVGYGVTLWKKNNLVRKSEAEDEDLQPGESVLHRAADIACIVTVTNRRIKFIAVDYKNLRYTAPDLPEDEKAEYLISDLNGVRAVNYMDIKPNKLKVKSPWGIQLTFKKGKVVNIPVKNGEEVASKIKGYIGSGF
ncbi:MAG: hypothetical protein U0T33_08685 [Bacteroidales bacterium]